MDESSKTVILSEKFQIVLPKKIREDLNLKAGQKLVLIEKGNSVELVRVADVKKARGMVKGISTKGMRDEHERFD